MVELAAWLVVVGGCDLLRAARDTTTLRRRAAIAAVGVLLLLFAAVAVGPDVPRGAVLLAGWVPCFLLWLLGSAGALSADPGEPASRGVVAHRAAAFAGLAGGILFGLLGSALVRPLSGALPGPLDGVSLEEAALSVGVVLVQLATANVAVRQVLDAVGVPASTNEKQLKGGRLLGPMERVFIVGLGLAGELTAAAVVVAAKGLLRFPELQRGAGHSGPSDISEYFLIGSFASWLAALGGLALLVLR